jgi:D-arabinitol dehydrogenase (NADP+)
LCQNFECLGNTQDGGYAEYTLAQTAQLVPLENLKPEAAVWLEPLACVLQALDKINNTHKSGPLLILGAGVLGKLMLQVILSTTRAQLAVIDPNTNKVAAAIELGAHTGWTIPRAGPAPETSTELLRWAPGGPLAIIDTTGSPEAIQRAIDWASPSGRILLFGVSDPTAMLSISPHQIFSKELTLLASSGMSSASFDAAYAMLRSEQIDPGRLVSSSIGLDELPAHLLGQAPKQEGKILVRPGYQAEQLK